MNKNLGEFLSQTTLVLAPDGLRNVLNWLQQQANKRTKFSSYNE